MNDCPKLVCSARATHYEVSEVDECPAKLLGHPGEGIERQFDEENETRVHQPGA